jgi:hypothetical protein
MILPEKIPTFDDMAAEANACYRAEQIEKKEIIAFIKLHINYPFARIKEILEDLNWRHEGYVKIELTDYKQSGYSNYDFYKEISGDGRYYMKQDVKGNFHTMVWQTVGFLGDDYSGFLLFPLTNGQYWKISYSC